MSTSPDHTRCADHLVGVLSRWLAGHADDATLRDAVAAVEPDELETHQADAVDELRAELERGFTRGALQMTVRETLEAVALGA